VGPARWLALIAALAVVGAVLLPESAEGIGWPSALGVFALGLVAPWLIERAAERLGHHHHAGGPLAVFGIVLHQGVDGFEIGAAHALDIGAWGVTFAIAVHTIPLVSALLVELGVSWFVSAGLIGGTMAGVVLGFVVPEATPSLAAWLPPVVAGLLLHILWHDLGYFVPGDHGQHHA